MGNCLGQLILAFKDFTNEDQFNSHLNNKFRTKRCKAGNNTSTITKRSNQI